MGFISMLLPRKIPLPRIIRENPFAILAYAILAVAAGLFLFLFALAQTLPSMEEIGSRQVAQSTKIFDRSGEVPLYEFTGKERRTVVPLAEIPASLKDAIISIENKNFYDEAAVSVKGIVRAALTNLIRGGVVEGGSTITQQLAKKAFLTDDRTPIRKLKELLLAIRLDRLYTKDQILELYLNEVPYGPTIYGAETASQAYFGKPVREVSIAEAAVLAALPKAPSYYSPWGNHTKELFARQRIILDKMREYGKITDAELAEAREAAVTFKPQASPIKAPHFVFAAQDYLIKKYGEETVRTGGLRVTTTLDARLQEIAERVVSEGAARNTKLYGGKNAALVAEDPTTGQVLAMVGSKDFFDRENDGNFNVATQGLRQPGSAMKPFVYLAAFKNGYTPETVVFDVPTEFVSNNPACPATPDYENENAKCFHPENFDRAFAGPVSLRAALARSINIPAVKTLYLVGLREALATLADFGVTTLTDPRRYGLSLVLGGGEVRLAELVGAYGALAADGVKHESAMILEVKNAKGEVLERYEDNYKTAIDAEYARMVTDVLSDVEARRPLYASSIDLTTLPGREVAVKTGTTNNYRDAWTFGYTPSLAAGVWAGNNDNQPMHRQGSSILAALPIWHAFMKEALETYPPETFARPAPVYPEKPILRGDYSADGVHSILYYIDKDDPTGPPPLNPEDDPQFQNWESGVLLWATQNLPPPGVSTSTNATSSLSGIVVQITSPQNGAFVERGVSVMSVFGTILSPAGLSLLRVYLNGTLMNEFPGAYPASYPFSLTITTGNLQTQNIIEIEGVSASGATGRSGVIVYRRE